MPSPMQATPPVSQACWAQHACETGGVACIGEGIQDDDPVLPVIFKPPVHEIHTDESSSTCDEKVRHAFAP